ncbi:hypothetical protein C8F04DRAFT_1215740 [Mycena alexandri]|uniref:C2H2-type domain-containing protein n=1 Tax=Mycena alexandri TaxID=1745969 RepID=A0AAD6WM54_9AGAR|nr:hypothetical protein C8F04DRAFT_1215740 [Mycena alexandri]
MYPEPSSSRESRPPRSSGHHCPVCTTRFRSLAACQQHMNQPHGRCHAAFHPAVLRAAKTFAERYPPRQEENYDDGDNFAAHLGDGLPDADMQYNDLPSQNHATAAAGMEPPPRGVMPEYFKGASYRFGAGKTFMDRFHEDEYAEQRKSNVHFPFCSADEWEFASFISNSNMSNRSIDELLNLRLSAKMHLSFRTAKDLRSRIEILPKGPEWKAIPWQTEYPTKSPLTLYYRDPLECLQYLLSNPLIQDHVQFTPFRLWANSDKLMRIYTEWLSGDVAWNMQEKLPEGATLLGAILTSDKTQLTAMTGNRSAYPLLISLADIDMDFRAKASHHAFLLLSLLPIAKFLEKNSEIRGVLASRLFHAILDFILAPLKKAAEIGHMMTDPLAYTLTQLMELEDDINPWDLSEYIKAAKALGLNGVHRPFWRDWPLAEPSNFLTPEILHHWLKMFYDHLVKWCLQAVGEAELDFRFAVLRISKAKQTTGREHRDIQRYIVPVIAEAAGVSKGFLATIASLIDFFYHGQSPVIGENVLDQMDTSLGRFHDHKQAILDAEARRGKKGPINNWHIPKLEFLQSVVPAIRANGVPLQWSADITEHAHITLVKDPASHSNNQKYEAQICRYLDRQDKCRQFDLATAMEVAGVNFTAPELHPVPEDCDDDDPTSFTTTTDDLLDQIEPVTNLAGTRSDRVFVNYFKESSLLLSGEFPNARTPYRRFTASDDSTAFHLNRDYIGRQIKPDVAAVKFRIPDFRPSLEAYLHRVPGSQLVIGGKRPALPGYILPVHKLEIWHNLRMQSRSFHDSTKILLPQTVNAYPPDSVWKFGRGDAVIVNTDSEYRWPKSGLKGHTVCQIRMIFRVVTPREHGPAPVTQDFLAYVQRFDIVPQTKPDGSGKGPFPEPASGMYLLKRARRSDKSIMGDVIPLDRLRAPVELTPRFGKKADRRLSKETSLDLCDQFWLPKWFNKEVFFALAQS